MGEVRIKVQRPWIGYPGSFVQQNYAEELVHGFLLWDIEDHDSFDVAFHALPNPKPYVTVDWADNLEATVKLAKACPVGARFRIRSREVLAQKDTVLLSEFLQQEMRATEVTFKSDAHVNSEVITTGATTIAKDDLRSPDVLLRLVHEFHNDRTVSEDEWVAVREQVSSYLSQAAASDDMVRNTKWSLGRLEFDNTFGYGPGNVIDFDKLSGICGVFGHNRIGKSSIVGTVMYALFNTTDRGNVKNLQVVNMRRPYCLTRAHVNVNGTRYLIERQTTKHENRHGQVHAATALNLFRFEDDGTLIDLGGEQRTDTEKVVRRLLGSGDDCMLTNVAAQDEIKLFINHGTSRRRQILSRFLDLDIFDRMYELAKVDVNASKGSLRNLPDSDWDSLEASYAARLLAHDAAMQALITRHHDASMRLHDARSELSSFKDVAPVTKAQLEAQQARVAALESQHASLTKRAAAARSDLQRLQKKVGDIDELLGEQDVPSLKKKLEAYRTLESAFDSLQHVYDRDAGLLKQQERSLTILDDVPCGDSFPTCRFIKDAHRVKDKVEPQRERVQRSLDRLTKARGALDVLKAEGLLDKVGKVEQLSELRSSTQLAASARDVELVRLEAGFAEAEASLTTARKRSVEVEEALKNDENAEVVSLRNEIDELQALVRRLDADKLSLASTVGRVQSDLEKARLDHARRHELLQRMRAHELIAQAVSRRGIPRLIVASQVPLINAELSKILHGIVDFNIEFEVDEDSDSMDVFINYGDSRRVIELASGMEKTIASIAIRVALINVSSLPKTDMFIIDEAFGPMDPASVEACNRLLTSLKRYFRAIIVITHVDGIKDVADDIIEVTKVEKDAKVTFE